MSKNEYIPNTGSPNPEDDFNLIADNLGPKCPCVLVLDVSSSMSGEKIEALNRGLLQFQQDLEGQDLARQRVDVAVITFGSSVEVAQTFIPAAEFQATELTTGGLTPMGEAIVKALDLVEERKEFYRRRGNPMYRPWIFLITDGAPTDDWRTAAEQLHEAEQKKRVIFWAVAVGNADVSVLEKISVRKPWRLKGIAFGELFEYASYALSMVSGSIPGEAIHLDKPSSDFIITDV